MPPSAGAGEPLPLTETPHRSIEGPATLTLAELPQPVSVTPTAMHAARIGIRDVARAKGIIAPVDRQQLIPCNSRGPSEAAGGYDDSTLARDDRTTPQE